MFLSESIVNPGWVKLPNRVKLINVGAEAVCVGIGCHLVFYNFITDEEQIYIANKWETGDGVACYDGHKQLPILAFAEQLLNPRILIINYPDFDTIKILSDGTTLDYMTLKFSDQDILLSLSEVPQCELIFWNWKTTQKLCCIQTRQEYPNQSLCCSTQTPILVIQYFQNATNFKIWETYDTTNGCIAIEHKIILSRGNKIQSCVWDGYGNAFFLNQTGCVYQMNSNYELQIIIYGEVDVRNPCFTWFKAGLLIKFSDSKIYYFKLKKDNWFEEEELNAAAIKQFLPCQKNVLLAWTFNSEIIQLNPEKSNFTIKRCYESISETFCFIYPVCNYFASLPLNDYSTIKVWKCKTGEEVGNFKIDGIITKVMSNPVYPYLAIGLSKGILVLLNCYNPRELKILTNFNLFHHEINMIAFNDDGVLITTGNGPKGLFFIIKGIPGGVMEILHYINYNRPTLDVCTMESENRLKLYLLVKTDPVLNISQRIVMKIISKDSDKIKKIGYISRNHKFTSLFLKNYTFLATAQNSKNLYSLSLHKKTINIVEEMHSGHQLKCFLLNQNKQFVYSYGYDGLIIIRTTNLKQIQAIILPHHRFTGGVENVIVDLYLRYAISFGKSTHELVCTNFEVPWINEKNLATFLRIQMSSMTHMFSDNTIGFEPQNEKDRDGKPCRTYLEVKRRDKIQEEELQTSNERQIIMKEFKLIKDEVIYLLNANLKAPRLRQIDTLEFYLYPLFQKHQEEITAKKCEWTTKYYKELIKAQDEICKTIKRIFDDCIDVKQSVVRGFFCNSFVENYPIANRNILVMPLTDQIEIYRQMECNAKEADCFIPWNVHKPQINTSILHITPSWTPERTMKHKVFNIEESEYELMHVDNIDDYLFTSANNYLTLNRYLYPQCQMFTNIHIICQIKFTEDIQHKLVVLFNKKYMELKQQKEKDFKIVIEKNNELRLILSELIYFSNLKPNSIEVRDPEWTMDEYIQNIFTVKNTEIGITPYVSPSEQKRLDAEAAEAERIRLMLLADDFREKQLIKMMYGVLEIRWEDTLRREIPKPNSLLTAKEDTVFTIDELQEIQQYENKIITLNNEIKTYCGILSDNFRKSAKDVRDIIHKFDYERLKDLSLYKMQINSTVLQNNFLLQFLQYQMVQNKELQNMNLVIEQSIENNIKLIKWIHKNISSLNNELEVYKTSNDDLIAKDKQIDKNFQRIIQDYSAILEDLSYRIFKKNPKITLKGLDNVSFLKEINIHCITKEKRSDIPQPYVNYLLSIDQLDVYANIPKLIDYTTFEIICKHRRLRLQNEIQLKINSIQRSQIENSIKRFDNMLQQKQELSVKLEQDLQKHREKQLEHLHDKYVHLVMKSGLVEVNQTGCIYNFDSAVLIHKKVVEDINDIVVKAGKRKIKAMINKIKFRQKIIIKEWEHKKLNMTIKDLHNEIQDIESITVTKDVLEYLKKRARGIQFDKGVLTYEQEIEVRKCNYESIINAREEAIEKLNKQIKEYKKKNKIIDEKISKIHISLCEKLSERDIDAETEVKRIKDERLRQAVRRSQLIRKIYDQRCEIVVLQTQLELLKLKNHPTLTFTTLGDI